MKKFTLLLFAFLATTAMTKFVPVPDYDISLIEGTWNVQSIYDTAGNNWTLAYCFQLIFTTINSSAINMTLQVFDGYADQLRIDGTVLYPNAENPAILYQDAAHKLAPLQVLNVSSIPYWVNNNTNTTIVAFNYTNDAKYPQYIIFGLTRAYDVSYDIASFIKINNIPINYTNNYWFINSACDAHFEWIPLKTFKADSLLRNWNLIAVYEPAGTGLAPWYTGGALYDWSQAYCAKVSFTPGEFYDDKMTLTLKSLYQGNYERTWQILPAPQLNAALMGFNIDDATLLYVQYADLAGNLVLTAGTTTSFFLSTSATSLTPAYRVIFEGTLAAMGWLFDDSLIYPIDGSTC